METIAVLGSGGVGQTLGNKFLSMGHPVVLGTRNPESSKVEEWKNKAGALASTGTYALAAAAAPRFLILCTKGSAALEVLSQIPEETLRGKILVDITNPLDDAAGFPFPLFTPPNMALAEQIQAACPGSYVVKTLNTLWAGLMVNPQLVNEGKHHVFLSGNDQAAKQATRQHLLEPMGWMPESILDLGDITTARGTEAWLPLWLRLYQSFGHAAFNIQIVQSPATAPA